MAEVFRVDRTMPNPAYVNADDNDPKRLVVAGDTVYLGDEHVSAESGVKVLDGEAARIEEGRFVWSAGTSTVSVYEAEVIQKPEKKRAKAKVVHTPDPAAQKRSEASRKAAATRKRNEAAAAKKRSEAALKAAATVRRNKAKAGK